MFSQNPHIHLGKRQLRGSPASPSKMAACVETCLKQPLRLPASWKERGSFQGPSHCWPNACSTAVLHLNTACCPHVQAFKLCHPSKAQATAGQMPVQWLSCFLIMHDILTSMSPSFVMFCFGLAFSSCSMLHIFFLIFLMSS